MKLLLSTLIASLSFAATKVADAAPVKNIVIVHGAFADGSGWEGVYRILTKKGFNVTIVQNPLETLASDVEATEKVIAKQDGPVVLVGHSYGGMVITQAGDDPKVKSLVYVAAYVPNVGESLKTLVDSADKTAKKPPIVADDVNKELSIDRAGFPEAFAADVNHKTAQFMAASQIPLAMAAFAEPITKTAWDSRPSYYIVSSQDQMIPPSDEVLMAKKAKAQVTTIKASHAVFISHPKRVAKVIENAAAAN